MEQVTLLRALVPEAVHRLEKLNKRATRNKLPLATYTIGEPFGVEEPRLHYTHIFYSATDTITRYYVDLEYTVEPVKVKGYSPVATFDFRAGREQASVFVWPDQEEYLPAGYASTGPICEHCGRSRRRNRTFMLRNDESGALLKVGKSCVRDFLGYNPERIIQQVKWLEDLAKWGGSDGPVDGDNEPRYRDHRGQYFHDVAEVVSLSCAVVREHGYVSRKAANTSYEDGDVKTRASTSDQVSHWMSDLNDPAKRYSAWEMRFHPTLTKEDNEKADKVIAEVLEIENRGVDGTYQHNLLNIAKSGVATPKEFGFTVSMVTYAERQWGVQAERKAKAEAERQNWLNSTWVGVVGDKVELDVTLVRYKNLASDWNVTHLFKFTDSDGNSITWFASRGQDLNVGDSCHIKGKVKAHNEYKGRRETVLTHCKISSRVQEVTT